MDDDLPAQQSDEFDAPNAAIIASAEYSGPLPPPGMLAAYEDVAPGSAQIILDAFQSEQAHRQKLEEDVIMGGTRRARNGQIFGFAVAMAFLAAAVVLVLTGNDVAGIILGTVDLVALVTVFVLGVNNSGSD